MSTSRSVLLAPLLFYFAIVAGSSTPSVAQDGTARPARLTLGGPPPSVRTEAELRAFLDELEAQELMISEALSLESYYQWRGKTRHFAGPFGRLSADLFTRRDYAAVLNRWKSRIRDSTLARRLYLHRRDFLVSRADPKLPLALVDLQTALQDTVTQFRFQLRGRQLTLTALTELVDTSSDRALRAEAFLARPQVSAHTRPLMVRAMALIDRIGRQQGFPNGAAAGLHNSTLEPGQVLRDLAAFERATRPAYEAILDRVKHDLNIERVEPWDIDFWMHLQETAAEGDPWPKEPGLDRLRDLMRGIGFAYDSLPIDITVRDVPTGGVTFWIRPPFEARLLTNPFSGSDFYATLFHEYGHAANAVLMRSDLPPIFFRGDETPLGEGLADALGNFAYDRNWLERAAGVPPAQAVAFERVGKMQKLLWLRRSIAVNAFFEITHYLDRGVNLDSLYAATYRRFVGVDLPAKDYIGTRESIATGPLYFQSYLYANMVAAQLHEAMRAEFGVDDLTRDHRVAGWLTQHFFASGAAIPWPEKIRRATGRSLTADALARWLADARP